MMKHMKWVLGVLALVAVPALAETDYKALDVLEAIQKGRNTKDQIQTLRVQHNATIGGNVTVTGSATISGGIAGLTLDGPYLTNSMVGRAGASVTNVAIHGSTIGAVNPSTGAFTTLGASGAATLSGGGTLSGGYSLTNTFTGLGTAVLTNMAIYGSTIGSVNPAAGAFTTLAASGALSLTGGGTLGGNVNLTNTFTGVGSAVVTNVALHGCTVGAVNPSTGAFTTLNASGAAALSGGGSLGGGFTLTNNLTGLGSVIVTNVEIHGSTIGDVYPLAGSFTTVAASGGAYLSGGGSLGGGFTLTNGVTGYAGANITNVALSGCTIGTLAPAAGAFTEVTSDGKYAVVGPDGASGLMVARASFTNGSATVTFPAVFSGNPTVICGWNEDLSGAGVLTNTAITAITVTPSNFVPKAALAPGDYTNASYIAVGIRP